MLAALLVLGILAYLAYSSSDLVGAFGGTREAHIFSTSVSAQGWDHSERAISQDLPANAPLESFNDTNSAVAVMVAVPNANSGGSGNDTGTTTPQEIHSDASSTPTIATSSPSETTAPQQSAPNPAQPAQIVAPATPPVVTPPTDTPAIHESIPSQTPPATDPGPTSLIRQFIHTTEEIVFAPFVPTVFATTSDASSSPDAPSLPQDSTSKDEYVASCFLQQTECHTLAFSGFGVTGDITKKHFKHALVNFSFADSAGRENGTLDDKLEVRYYHAGKWKQAGEMYLNKDLSNESNGGYFSAPLDDITDWQSLDDLKVVIEYVRADTGKSTRLYLDSLWINAQYTDTVLNILNGSADQATDSSDNVSLSLRGQDDAHRTLVLPDGNNISFNFTDDLDDGLPMRSDRKVYTSDASSSDGLFRSTVYVSVSNPGDSPDSFTWSGAFFEGKGSVTGISQFLRNVASSTEASVQNDVTYLCDSQWQSATTTGSYSCSATGEVHQCSWLNATKQNCLESDVTVATSSSVAYLNDWVPQDIEVVQSADDTKLPNGYKTKNRTRKSFDILPGQTLYFRVQLETTQPDPQKFYLYVNGGTKSGDLESARLKKESDLVAQKNRKGTVHKGVPHVKRAQLNDQLSEKTEFNADDRPSFEFKFKTQRGLFTRIKDRLLGTKVAFEIKDTKIEDANGDETRLPVDINYGSDETWNLTLGSPTREIKPGKYTIDMTIIEAGHTYTDTVDFFWGVLAENTDKATYEPGENAHFEMAALTDSGNTMCDASLVLSITAPSGEITDVPVQNGLGCGMNNVTDQPDYFADYTVDEIGTSTVTLSRLDQNGSVINSVTDVFYVEVAPALSVSRTGPTRIYPIATYPMSIEVTANEAFTGTVTESLPEGFTVPDAGGATLTRDKGVVYLTWNVSLAVGETADFSYVFDAPDASPYLYLLGPLKFTRSDGSGFEEGRTWKVASDAVPVATGVAWLTGTSTTNGNDLNNNTPFALQFDKSEDYDDAYYSHSTSTSPSRLTVNIAGDYLVAVNVPWERADTSRNPTTLEVDIRVNGAKQTVGVGRSYTLTRSGVGESSSHVYALVRNLSVGDYIEAYSHTITTVTAGDVMLVGTRASMYVEYIPSTETVYTATATTTVADTNLNTTGATKVVWYDGRKDTGYTHANATTSSPENVTIAATGDYMTFINIPLNGAVAGENVRARVVLNGVVVTGGNFKQGYISNSAGATQSSLQWSGVVHATSSNSVFTVDVQQEGAAGTMTVGSDVGSLFMQKLPSTDVYFGSGQTLSGGGTNFNITPAQSIRYATDTVADLNAYTHSTTTNSHQVTVKKAGDYLLAINDSLSGAVTRGNIIIQVQKNGVDVSGAATKNHYMSGVSTHSEYSGSLVFMLRDLAVNDVISVTTVLTGTAGTVTADEGASIMLWRKNPQSLYQQNTYRWYANVNGEPPTDPWPSGAVDVLQGDPITNGIPIKSSDVVRLRMNLLAVSTTTAFADSFKLQYAAGSTCSAALSWTDVGAIGSGAIWRGYDNAGVTNNTTLSSTTLTNSNVKESYVEQNPSTTTPNGVGTGQNAEYDWTLQDNGATVGGDYCFRMVDATTGQGLKSYLDYPALTTNSTPDIPVLAAPFDNEKSTSTTPWFDFAAAEINGENVHYEVQVSTDPNFGTTLLDRDSFTNYVEFQNTTSPANKSPFNQSDKIRFIPTTALSNGTTYWWRVRAKDPTGTNTYGSWSISRSVTVDTSVTVSTWHQTTQAQFLEDQLLSATTTIANDVQISGVLATSTVISPQINFSGMTYGNTWGSLTWNDAHVLGTIMYQVQYFTSTSSWALIPDTDLPGNSLGTSTQPISLANLDVTTYGALRVVANMTRTTGTPTLFDWTVNTALSVTKPVLSKPFDNEKTATTTPTFQFISTDPQSDRLRYQVEWSTDSAFGTGTFRISGTNAGFSNTASSTDTDPFTQNNTIQFQLQSADVLTNGTTYWWRVRAIDPTGGNAFSQWSAGNSFTVDTSLAVSTWFQTTQAQFAKDTFIRTIASTSNSVISSVDTGKIAIFRTATAGEALTTSVFTHGFDTTVRRDDVYALSGTTTVGLKKGHYAVLYSTRFDSTGGTNRTDAQTNLNIAGVNSPIGWSSSYLRRLNGAQEGFNAGGGIIYAPADSTQVLLQSFRTDANVAATETRVASTTLQFVKLDDAWDYVRLGKKVKQTGPTSASWLTISYDRQDELDTGSFDHTVGSGNITLKSVGHYLIFANTYGSLATGSTIPSQVKQKIILNGADVEGSFTTVYMNGNANGNAVYQGAAAIGMIIESTTTNTVLNVQLARSIGTSAWSIDADNTGAYVDRTGVTIVKIPDGSFVRLQNSSAININTATTSAYVWDTENEKDASFTHSNSTNNSRITATVAGDYLLFGNLFAQGANLTDGEPGFSWAKNAALIPYGVSGTYSANITTSDAGNWSGMIMPSVVNGDFFEFMSEAYGLAGSMPGDRKALEGMRIASLTEADTNPVTVESQSINFSDGTGPKWATFSWSATQPASTSLKMQLEYLNASGTYALVPDNAGFIAGYLNSVGTTSTSTINISGLSRITYATIRGLATFTCGNNNCPTLDDWTASWAQGIQISGTAKKFDETTNVTSGTVAVAVNGVLQAGKTGTISAGVWTIANVTAFTGDVITVYISGAADPNEAVAVSKYLTTGDVTGMELYEDHLSLGSNDNPTLTNADIDLYDNSTSGNEDIFDNVTAGPDLLVCAITGCSGNKLYIRVGTTFEPNVSLSRSVTTKDISIKGILIADGNSINVSGSWADSGQFAKGNSTVNFTATSTTESVDFTGATSTSFNNATFGSSGTATWNLLSALDVTGTLTINNGTLSQNGNHLITLSGDLTIGSSGAFTKGTASTTFNGTTSKIWTDSSASKQDLGDVFIDGAAKTVTLGSSVKATNITIGADDTFNLGGANTVTVNGNWTNNNAFVPQTGTVLFAAMTTGNTITPGTSGFYNLTFNGSGGNWAFSGATASITNDFTVTNGTITLPTGTTTIAGNFSNSATFQHNNGTVLLTAASAKTITTGASTFYDLTFNGSGSWSFTAANATSSRNVTITTGTVTMPSGTFAIGGFFAKNGGSFTHNSGTLKFTATTAQTLKLGGSDANNLTFSGVGGSWSFADTNATSTGTFRIENGTTTLPSGLFTVAGSWTIAGGAFVHNSGTVKFNAGSSGQTIQPNGSNFFNIDFNGASGGWTIAQSATSTNNFTLTNAATFTLGSGFSLGVGGTFTNAVAPATTTWSGSTLTLYSGGTYSINTKSNAGDTYATLVISSTTKISMWNSSASTSTVSSGSYLYSQNNAAVSGDLYIAGVYTRSSGTEYWSYATDFDGTALGGSSRRVNVRVATSSTLTFSGGTLQILGSASASTTIDNQGSGAYAFAVSGGTLNAQYYQVRNTDLNGLNISGATSISSLSDGDFQLGVNGGTMIKVASTVIDANVAFQILRNRFATSSGVSVGSNVTETGVPGSYWWFRSHYGNYAGESFDNDPKVSDGGNPGYIRWDDSNLSINISGRVYSDHGSTVIGNPPCDGVTPVVKLVVNSGTSYTAACNAGTGLYTISGVTVVGDVVLTAFLDTNGGTRAVTISRTPSADIANFDLYQDVVIVRHEDVTPITIAQLAFYDSTKDTDIPFTASTSTPPSTLAVKPGTELYVWAGKTFTPGGNVTLQSGGNGNIRDGRLMLATSSAYLATGSETHAIGGGLSLASGDTFGTASSTFTFTATTTNKSFNSSIALSFYNLVFNGTGGGWSLDSAATTSVTNSFAMTAGTLSGTGDMNITSGSATGGGTIAMTGGTLQLTGSGSIGSASSWTFNNLILGSGAVDSTSKTGVGTTTVSGMLRITSGQTLNASSTNWVFTGGGSPFVVNGTFNVQSAPFFFTSNASTTIADVTYAMLTLAPASAGTPVYTLKGGALSASVLTLGGVNPVLVDADFNDPSIGITGTVTIGAGSTFKASNTGAFDVGGSWQNNGSFLHQNGSLNFNSSATGNTVNPGSSSFYDLSFNNVAGGWTIAQNATTSRHFTLTRATNFTLASGKSLSVGGTFTNGVGGAATTWATTTLSLTSGTAYAMNTKSVSGDVYGTLSVSSNTNVNMWNSSAATTTVASGSSLYSQNNASVSGDLYIWGDYSRSSGTEYWDYATDFDGTSLATSTPRAVTVRIATSSTLTFTGGTLEILGTTTATTSIAVQGSGRYAFSVSGGTLNAQYYKIRDTDINGLNITGTTVVTSLSDGDFLLASNGGTTMTVAASVIDANPLKIIMRNNFATTSVITGGSNVKESGAPASSWKFNLHYGNFAGEAYDNDPAGDPGYLRWDDSSSQITISGKVYSDEGTTTSAVCNGVTQVVRLKIQGAGILTSSCSGTGLYSIPGVAYNPGDVITVYLDTNGGVRAATVSLDPISSIANFDLYENRVIVRHEDVNPITIAKLATYDSDNDTDIPYNATVGAPNTLVLLPNTKLIVWDGKIFTPGGNVTLQSGGSGSAWDGTLELRTNATWIGANNQSHSIGGSLSVDNGALLTSASSTFTFTATTSGKTIALQNSSLFTAVFNGGGGNWSFPSGSAIVQNDFSIATGTVTFGVGTTTIGGSLFNSGGIFQHNNGTIVLNASSTGKSIKANGNSFYNLTLNGSGGAWTFSDTNATSSNNFIVTNGSTTLPVGIFAVGAVFDNSGTFTAGVGTVKLIATASGKNLKAGGSSFYNLTLDGIGGVWSFLDANATTTRDFTITNGSTTLPSSTFNVGGSFVNAGAFSAGTGLVTLSATTTGKLITASSSTFYDLTLNSAAGGWTITGNATSSNNFSLTNAASFTLTSGKTLAVGGAFTNGVGGAPTTWATTTLSLYSGTGYSMNTKTTGGDTYGTLLVASSTNIRLWNSSAATTTVLGSGSVYSQNNANVPGDLYIWGTYAHSSGTEYWDYATDFDGTALGGSSRAVNVRIATSSSLSFSGGTLEVLGTASATTTIQNQGLGRYAFAISGGTVNAQYYQVRNTDPSGINFTGSPTLTSLDAGDLELGVSGGALITVAGSVIDANASKVITNVRFATSTGILAGNNIVRTGSPISAWTFTSHYGNIAGEAYDTDGVDACGALRWSDSVCLFVSQEHYRWRNDDGGDGAPNTEWYSLSWAKREKIAISNPNGSVLTSQPVKIIIPYTSSMQSNFSDLRFTDSSGTTTIPYWIEKYTASASSTVWVKVPSLPASGSANVYMYYGNNAVTDGSSGTTTFKTFEDFESNSISGYSGNTTMFQTAVTFNHNHSYGLDAGSSAALKTTTGLYKTGSLIAQGDTLRFYQYVDSTQTDEPCTLFAVGGSGSNYAVCLDQYPTAKVVISKDVTANDQSGTVLASTTVTYTTGWYEVVVDWLATNVINVNVYTDTGTLFATTSVTDSSHTAAGGYGFSYWFMHGGWDFLSVRPYIASQPTYVIGTEQVSGGASWKVAEDTLVPNLSAGQNVRLRFSIQDSGASVFGQLYRLQYAPKGVSLNCESVAHSNYSDVPTTSGAGCGSAAACMTTTAQYSDGASTAGLLSYPAAMSFINGHVVSDPSQQTASSTIAASAASEVEYNLQIKAAATANAYCFRVANDGPNSNSNFDLDNYAHVAEATMAYAPTISNFNWPLSYILSGIALTEGTTTTVSATGTVTDYNGYADIVSATSSIYRSGVGSSCTSNSNNCYPIPACTLSNCAGTSCTITCSANVQYLADPTDVGSANSAENWLASLRIQDSIGLSATSSTSGAEINTLFGLTVNTGAIDFGALSVGTDTGTFNATSTVVNTGNAIIDIQLSGTDLAGSNGSLAVGQQRYATSTFTYGSCSVCQFLTGSSTPVDVNIPKATTTATSTQTQTSLFWGINVPIGTTAELHQGTNTFIAVHN